METLIFVPFAYTVECAQSIKRNRIIKAQFVSRGLVMKPKKPAWSRKGSGNTMANVGHVRVSTVEQNEGRQVAALKPHSIDKWFIDKASGKNTDRPQFKAMLDYIRESDTVYVEDFS